MRTKILNACLFGLVMLLLSGCGNNYLTEYNVGVIYTTEYKNKSKINFLNEKLKEVNSLPYRYSSMSYDGFSNALIADNELYLLPKGHADKLDYGKVISLNLVDGKIKEYDFGRTNITDFEYNSGSICVSSNLNGKNYIDVYNMQNAQIQTMELQDVMVSNLVMEENRIFGVMMDLETDSCFLCEFNLMEDRYEIMYEMEADPDFMELYDGNLYVPQGDILYEYNIEERKVGKIKLPHTNAYNLNLIGDILYIGCTDILNGTKSYVDIMHLPDKKILKSIQYEGIILQMEISKEDKLYILDYQKLSIYDISKEETVLVESMELTNDGAYYVGGFYLNEIEK